MHEIACVIQDNHQVAGPGICNRGLSPGHASLPPDFVGDESGPSATSSGRAGVLVVIFRTSIPVGNLCNAVLGRRSARAEASVALAEVSLARISGLQLVQDFRYVGFRNRLAIGERTASGSLGRLRLGSRLDGLRCRSFRLGLGLYCGSVIELVVVLVAGDRRVLSHTLNNDSCLSAVHDVRSDEAAVRVTRDNTQGIDVLHGVLILAGDILIVRNLSLDGRLLAGAGGKALGFHDIGHQLSHIVPVNAGAHGRSVSVGPTEAGVIQTAVLGHGHVGGSECAKRVLVVISVVLGNLVGIKCPGQHGREVALGNRIGGSESTVCIAVDNAFPGAVNNSLVERVRGRNVREADGQCDFILDGFDLGSFNLRLSLSLGIAGPHDSVHQGLDDFLVLGSQLVQVRKLIGAVPIGVEIRDGFQIGTGLSCKGRDGQRQRHNECEHGRKNTAQSFGITHDLITSLRSSFFSRQIGGGNRAGGGNAPSPAC